jgi:hypothetical protein
MSILKFSFALMGILRRYKKCPEELADASRYPLELIYSWRYDRGDIPNQRDLIKLARVFATSPHEVRENHLSLLYALLQDFCTGPGAEYINIEILPTALPIVATAWSIRPMRRRSENDLEAIRKHIWYDERLQKAISDLAKPLRSKRIPLSIAKNNTSENA